MKIRMLELMRCLVRTERVKCVIGSNVGAVGRERRLIPGRIAQKLFERQYDLDLSNNILY
jgi:hypothetical protein